MSDYIKSPMNYIGGKYKLLPQLLPLFPQKISMFYIWLEEITSIKK